MKSKVNSLRLILYLLALFIMIIDSKTAISAANVGINMCLRAIIPSLFPAMIICDMLVHGLTGTNMPLVATLEKLIGIPDGAGKIFISGILGGYPVGAKIVGQQYITGNISKQEAQNLLAYCNNAGPAFIFGLCGPMFPDLRYPFAIWLIHITASMIVARISHPEKANKISKIIPHKYSIYESINACTKTMALICSWIILFRIIIEFIKAWILWIVPASFHPIIIGLLELSNGILLLGSAKTLEIKFILCSLMLALGGCCILLQTKQVIGSLSIKTYLFGKVAQAVISVALSFIFLAMVRSYISLNGALIILQLISLIFVISGLLAKKYVAFSLKVIYNTGKPSAR